LPPLERAVVYIPEADGEGLSATATETFVTNGTFQISTSALKKAYTRRREYWVRSDGADGKRVVVLPALRAAMPACLVHAELGGGEPQTLATGLAAARALLALVAPVFEALTMRRSNDAWFLGVVEAINVTLEAKDTYTSGHSERVGRFSLAIASELGLGQTEKRWLLASAICHDLGKIGIADAVLRKPGLLSADEYEEMKAHPLIGESIVRHLPGADVLLAGIKYHHERWDGTGYPDGLAGTDIPLVARVISVADAFDAMTSGRIYSGYVEPGEAVQQLAGKEDLFDPELLRAFAAAFDNGKVTLRTGTQIGVRA
jgi:HD-GYP domain-containing protein (c-di-GMP phosphodiesterase class II)